MWGKYGGDSSMDMVLALPAETLSSMGFTGLPSQAMLPIKVRGQAQHPSVDWTG